MSTATPRQEFEIASLAPDTRAVLIGRGWECFGEWRWAVRRPRRGNYTPNGSRISNGRANAPAGGLDQLRHYRAYIDLSRPTEARIPGRDAPTHWAPLAPIEVETLPSLEIAKRYINVRARPSPAHQVLPEEQGGVGDALWPYRYAPVGSIARAEVEHRMLRGLKTSRQPGVVRHVETGFKSNWPVAQMVAGWGDYAPPITVRDFNPTRRDLDDWWIALSWFARLYPAPARKPDWQPGDLDLAQKIVIWRSLVPAYSWRQIGDRLGRSNEWARRRYEQAIDRAWELANEADC